MYANTDRVDILRMFNISNRIIERESEYNLLIGFRGIERLSTSNKRYAEAAMQAGMISISVC